MFRDALARRRQGPAHRGCARGSALNQVAPFALLVLILFAFALDPDSGVLDKATPGLFWVAVLFCGLLAIQRAFAVEAADGNRDALRLSGLDAGRHLPRQGAGHLRSSCWSSRCCSGVGVVLLYSSHATGLAAAGRHLRGRDRWDRCGRYALRRSRRRSPGPGDAAAAAAAPGARPGADRRRPGPSRPPATARPARAGPGSGLLAVFAVAYTVIGALGFGSLLEES